MGTSTGGAKPEAPSKSVTVSPIAVIEATAKMCDGSLTVVLGNLILRYDRPGFRPFGRIAMLRHGFSGQQWPEWIETA